ncbi:tyrosine-type recombinase/integrase [Empedobacter sp.]|uniref:tyrosine-type recombinase/integrase n=2 Tax=Empedobacter sp. TaxID=1927715 RepID=UPI0028AAC4BA|nr:tyrosine-type recombinase/integrase [Empedobacter sp.]
MIVIGKFKVQEAKSGSKLVYRIRHANNVDIKITLNHIVLDLNKWDNFSQSFRYKRTEKDYKKSLEVNKSVILFSQFIQEEIYSPEIKNNKLTSKWLREKYYDFFGFENPNQNKDKIDDEPYFIDYYNHYISTNKKIEGQAKNGKNLSQNTIKGYTTMINYWRAFLIHQNQKDFKLQEIDSKIFEDYIKYQESEAKLGTNSIDTNTNKFKAILNYAKSKSIKLHEDYLIGNFKFSGVQTNEIYLNDDEINLIYNLFVPQNKKYLENARRWFIIQLHTGLRISDLFALTIDKFKNGFIETKTIKTHTDVVIPVFNPVKEILSLNNGNLPKVISEVKYNKYIKEVCELAGINELVSGSKFVVTGKGKNKRKRKVIGNYFKYELVSSHTSRRSLFTNLAKKSIPLSDLSAISGHSSIKTLENYIRSSKFEKANSVKEKLESLNIY